MQFTHAHSHLRKWGHTMHRGLSFAFIDWIWGDWTGRILETRNLPPAPRFPLHGGLQFCCLILFSSPSPKLLPLLTPQAKNISPPHPRLGQGKKPIANDVRTEFVLPQGVYCRFFWCHNLLNHSPIGHPCLSSDFYLLCAKPIPVNISLYMCVSVSYSLDWN